MNLKEIKDRYFAKAQEIGVELEILFQSGSSFSTSYLKGERQDYQFSQTQSLGFRMIQDDSESCSFSESLKEKDLDIAFEEAKQLLPMMKKTYKPRLMQKKETTDMPFLYNDRQKDYPVNDKMQAAKDLEAAATGTDERIQSVPYSGYGDFDGSFHILNTNGVELSYKRNGCYVYAYPLASEKEENRMAVEVQVARDLKDLDAKATAEKAAKKALGRLGAQTPKSGNYPVVLDRNQASSLIGFLAGSFSAESLDKGLSLLKNKKGQKVISELIEITDDPFREDSDYSRPFDDEGAPSQKTSLVKAGVIENYITNLVYAEKMNLPHTANASRSTKSNLGISTSNFVVSNGNESLEDLLSKYPELIYIDDLNGLHAGYNSISGDFSLEAEGALYKNGKKECSLGNFVLSGNLLEMLANVEALADDGRYENSSVIAPSILVSSMSIAGS